MIPNRETKTEVVWGLGRTFTSDHRKEKPFKPISDMGRKLKVRSLFFWIALVFSELEIVFQHQRVLKSSILQNPFSHLSSPEHDFPLAYPLAPNNYAYAYVVADCDPSMPESYQGILFSILVNIQLLESQGSKADVVVMIKMSEQSEGNFLPSEDQAMLNAFPQVKVRYLLKSSSFSLSSDFLDKFRILELTQYRRILYMDTDVVPLCNLDYLFHLSEKGILKDNLILAGNDEAINRGFMMLRPGAGEFQQLMNVVPKDLQGWHALTSKFDDLLDKGLSTITQQVGLRKSKQRQVSRSTVSSDELELLYYWVKYIKKSASVVMETKIENWGSRIQGSRPILESTIKNALNGYDCWIDTSVSHNPRQQNIKPRPFHNIARQLWHFDDKQAKFWMTSDPNKVLPTKPSYRPIHLWFQTLHQVKLRLNVTELEPSASMYDNTLRLRSSTTNRNDRLAPVENGDEKKYAYAYILAGVDPDKPNGYRGILFGILVNAQVLEASGSKADIVVLVQMAFESKSDYLPKEEVAYLRNYPKILVHYIPRPLEPHSFYSTQFDKFRILELTQYRRILYFDADVTPLCNMDYLFHMSEKGIFRENMLLAGSNEPSNGGFMMLRPRQGDYDEILRIIDARDAHILATSRNHTFDPIYGWGHVIMPPDKWRTRYNKQSGTKWDFNTAFGDQGLMLHWAKYVKKDVSIFIGNEVDNWSPPVNANDTTPVLEATLVDAIKGYECQRRMEFSRDSVSKLPYDLEGQLLHFTGKEGKPWMVNNLSKAVKGNDTKARAYRFWFDYFGQVTNRLNITVDFQKELRADPALESLTLTAPMRKILQRKHAYAFLLGDVDPAHPIKYRATLYSILVNVQLLEFYGSTPDIVVMVQMAHDSDPDQLPEKDAASLKAYSNVVIHYLPKPPRAHTFYTFQLEKFRILELTRYRRVLYMDTDMMPLCHLDYLFYLSEKGTFKENLVVAGDNEPAKRGFMMLRPGKGEYQHLMSILDHRDNTIWSSSSTSNLTIDEGYGWGHPIRPPDRWRARYDLKNGTLWNFPASFGDQGLLYHWVKYVKKSASLFIGNEVENWSSAVRGSKKIPVLESTLVDALKGFECSARRLFPVVDHAQPPYDLEGQVWHFDGVSHRPWNLKNSKKVLSVDKKQNRPYHMWFQLLRHVKKRLRSTLNVEKDLQYHPKVEVSSVENDFRISLERRHAYAFVLAGVSPERPQGYIGILFSILVNAHKLESWGSKADIVVLVQMAHDSEWDRLPHEILRYFHAYPSIVIHYLPKPREPPSFYSAQFEKFFILELTQYRRVLYLDADVMPMCNFDYLFHLSEKGVFKENMILAGNNEPSNGGFMMLRPKAGEYQKVKDIIEERDARIMASPSKVFDEVVGWGHVIKPPDYWRTRYNRKSGTFWNFTTAYGNQGLMFYWVKYVKKSASLFVGNEVENWGPPASSAESTPVLQETLVDAIRGYQCPTSASYVRDKYRKGPYDLEGQLRHFDGKYRKPWMLRNTTEVIHDLGYRMWFEGFEQVKQRLKVTIDLNQLRHNPKLGSWTLESDFLASLERKLSNSTRGDDDRRKSRL